MKWYFVGGLSKKKFGRFKIETNEWVLQTLSSLPVSLDNTFKETGINNNDILGNKQFKMNPIYLYNESLSNFTD